MSPIEEFKEGTLDALTKIFEEVYKSHLPTEYHMRSRYGKYSIYRWDYEDRRRISTTLARGLRKEEAQGMMKLLKGINNE